MLLAHGPLGICPLEAQIILASGAGLAMIWRLVKARWWPW